MEWLLDAPLTLRHLLYVALGWVIICLICAGVWWAVMTKMTQSTRDKMHALRKQRRW